MEEPVVAERLRELVTAIEKQTKAQWPLGKIDKLLCGHGMLPYGHEMAGHQDLHFGDRVSVHADKTVPPGCIVGMRHKRIVFVIGPPKEEQKDG